MDENMAISFSEIANHAVGFCYIVYSSLSKVKCKLSYETYVSIVCICKTVSSICPLVIIYAWDTFGCSSQLTR